MESISIRLPRAHRITDALLMVVMTLIAFSILGQCSKYLLGHPMLKGFVPLFYVDFEASAPTWYSSAALGLAGGLFALIAAASFRAATRHRWYWATLAVLLLGLSADEIAMIHEMPIDPMREMLNWGGLLHYGWVVPGAAFVAVVGVVYLRFLFALPTRIRNLFLLSATVFVSGAIGVEMLSGLQADRAGEDNLNYALIVTIEEFLEMLGVVILVRALLEYIEQHLVGLQIQFAGVNTSD